jgi:hypothetical protein
VVRAAGPMAVTAAGRPARSRRWPGAAAWAVWALTLLSLAVLPWLDRLLRQAGRPDLVVVTADAAALVLGSLSPATVGAVLASRRPRHPVGWLLLTLGAALAVSGAATGYASYGLLARPGALPAAAVAAHYHGISALLVAASLGFVLLLTPTGRLPSPRWRWWARVAVAAPALAVVSTVPLPFEDPYGSAANPVAVAALADPLRTVNNLTWAVTALGIPVGAASLVVRFRRARGTERQQLRWVAFAAALTALTALVLLALVSTADPVVLGWATGICVMLLPLATGAAILRYRLYDLDRIISRTVAWTLLTVLLGLGYAGVVLGLGRLLPQGSSLGVAAATLAVAAAFQPARRRIQRLVDRRFNRRRHDAARTLEAFAARLRDQLDLTTLRGELLAVVTDTMQPTQASLWLHPRASAPPSGDPRPWSSRAGGPRSGTAAGSPTP